MEQVLEWIVTLLRAMLGILFVLTPGMLFWLVVVSIFTSIRLVGRSGPYQRLRHRSQTTQSPSAIQN